MNEVCLGSFLLMADLRPLVLLEMKRMSLDNNAKHFTIQDKLSTTGGWVFFLLLAGDN